MAEKKKKSKKLGLCSRVLWIGAAVMTIVFVPSAIMLGIGMLPSIIAATLDRSKKPAKSLTVAAMNFAGCSPFLIKLWTHGNSLDETFRIVSDPRTIIIIYSAAGAGYLIDWAMTGLIANIMVQNGRSRQKEIARLQAGLVGRWGQEVTGEIPLDPYGFPLEAHEPKK